jgi:hypothetical protein
VPGDDREFIPLPEHARLRAGTPPPE